MMTLENHNVTGNIANSPSLYAHCSNMTRDDFVGDNVTSLIQDGDFHVR